MKSKIKTIAICLATFVACQPICAEEAPNPPPADDEIAKPIPIDQIKEDTPIGTLWVSYSELSRNSEIPVEVKIRQRIQILIITHIFLKNHSYPEGVVPWNIRPPDGGISGSAPESIKDPKLRAQYVKTLEENKTKSEKQSRYRSYAALQDDIISASSLFTYVQNDKTQVVSDAIDKYAKSPEQAKELKQMITDAAVKRGLKPTKWPAKTE